jgi:hypothetical protein
MTTPLFIDGVLDHYRTAELTEFLWSEDAELLRQSITQLQGLIASRTPIVAAPVTQQHCAGYNTNIKASAAFSKLLGRSE